MSENIKNRFVDTTEEEEYTETVNKLRAFFNKKLEDRLLAVNVEMSELCLKVLGEDFVLLVKERDELIREFRLKETELLRFAAVSCGANKEIMDFFEWINDESVKKKVRSKRSREFIKLIKEKVGAVKPELVSASDEIQKKIVKNMKDLEHLFLECEDELGIIKKKYRDELQNDIDNFISGYTEQLNEINVEFGKEKVDSTSPFEEGYRIMDFNLDTDDEEEQPLPFKINGKDVIN